MGPKPEKWWANIYSASSVKSGRKLDFPFLFSLHLWIERLATCVILSSLHTCVSPLPEKKYSIDTYHTSWITLGAFQMSFSPHEHLINVHTLIWLRGNWVSNWARITEPKNTAAQNWNPAEIYSKIILFFFFYYTLQFNIWDLLLILPFGFKTITNACWTK